MSSRRNILSEAVPVRGEVLGLWLPSLGWVFTSVAVAALVIGLVWRGGGTAPPPLVLCHGVSALVWGVAFLLHYPLVRLLRRGRTLPGLNQSAIWSCLWVVVLLCLSGFALGMACLGLTLAYDPATIFFVATPIDVEPQSWSVAKLVLWLILDCATPWFMLSLGSLTLLRAYARQAGTLLWLWLGLLLHLPLVTGLPIAAPYTPGGLASLLVSSLNNSEGMLRYHMLAPVHNWLYIIWGAGVTVAIAAALTGGRRTVCHSALGHAVAAGLAAGVLRTLILGREWVADPTLLVPDTVASLAATVLTVTALAWLLLAWERQPAAALELRRSWWLVPGLCWTTLLLTAPVLVAGRATRLEALATTAVLGVMLLTLLALAALLLRMQRPLQAAPGHQPAYAGLPLLALLASALCLRTADGRLAVLALLEDLQAASFAADQRLAAVSIAAACLLVCLVALTLHRRPGIPVRSGNLPAER